MKMRMIDLISRRLPGSKGRFLLGICGAPGAGKSTLAVWIVAEWNRLHAGQAVLVPMDGYHLSNEELEAMGLLSLKGIPETFDAGGFLKKLSEIRQLPEKEHHCPRFDRLVEASVQNAIKVHAAHKLVVIEGNYLLLDTSPWNRIKDILDEIWFIEADEAFLFPRLLARHQEGGKSAAAAAEKVNSTDLPNARLVAKSRARADRLFRARDLELPPLT